LPEARHEPPRRRSDSGAGVRAQAARTVNAVHAGGRSLTDALAEAAASVDARDRALLHELCFGTLRLLPRLQALTGLLLKRPLKPADAILQDLMAIGLYQLTAMRIPAHAAVAATVGAVRVLERPHAAGLLNATLRRFQRESDALLAQVADDESARWLLPHWLLARLQQAWPRHWQAIVDAGNSRAPMTLRVNLLRGTRADYAAALADAGIAAKPLAQLEAALQLDHPLPTERLPGFAEGKVSVQDASAQFAAQLLGAAPGERILDACAAPGGKTAHLIERTGGAAQVTALDADPERMQTLRRNLERLGLHAETVVGDAAGDHWQDGPYRRILLDAPCSATGVIRRHPDIKWLRRDADIDALAATQRAMLDNLWPHLLPGGYLLYATCSLLPEENEAQVRAFLQRHADAREVPLAIEGSEARAPGRQLFPQPDGGDGFYYALLEKAA
jgi:16S rRNA (cytosine967-C5)-methyltransferase